jgi:isocitrate lyase
MKNHEAMKLQEQWDDDRRWEGIVRPYTPDDVLRLRGSIKVEYTLARMGAERFWNLIHSEPLVRALGAQTGAQAVEQVQAGLKAIYISGWQVAGDMNAAQQTYPDQSLYPANSVPTLVQRINNALRRADQIACMGNGKAGGQPYWFAPIVADAEAGFGGPLNAFEIMKAMIEAGAAAVHFEDQNSAYKKCGHMGGKVLVPTQTAIQQLVAARLAADVLDVPTVLIGRTDSLAAKLLTSDFDQRDQAFLTGRRTADGFFEVREGIEQAIARAVSYAPYADMIWCETSTPDVDEAREFARGVHDKFPGKPLAYNCSPSFNWKLAMGERELASFQRELAAMGYRFQFVTLAGFHALNMSMFELAHAYRDNGMLAYSQLQEREFELEAEHGYRAVKHQSFVGAGYFDAVNLAITGGESCTLAIEGSTEQQQFTERTPGFLETEIHHADAASARPVPPASPLVQKPGAWPEPEMAGK